MTTRTTVIPIRGGVGLDRPVLERRSIVTGYPLQISRRLDAVLPPDSDFASALRMQVELARLSARQG